MLQTHAGKSAVFQAMRSFLDEHANDSRLDFDAQASSFIQHLKQPAGTEWAGFVDDWTHSLKQFDPAIVSLRQQPVGDEYEVNVELQHLGALWFPVPVRLNLTGGGTKDFTWTAKTTNEIVRLKSLVAVVSAEIDPEHRLLDWNRGNNRALSGAGARPAATQVAIQATGWKTYTTTDGLPGTDVRCLMIGKDRHVYAGIWSLQAAMNREWAIAVYDRQWQRYEPRAEPIHLVSAMAQQDNGSFWLASQNHLRRMREDDSTNYQLGEIRTGGLVGHRRFRPNPYAKSSLPGSQVYALLADNRDRLWIGTDHGLTVLESSSAEPRPVKPGAWLDAQEVFALAQDKTGTIWAGTERGLYFLVGDAWQAQPHFPRDLVLSIAASPEGLLWCGTYRSGVVAVQNGAVRQFSRANAPIPDTIFSRVAADPQRRLWAGTPDGLIHFDGHHWTRFTRANSGLPSHQIHCVACDDGRVWIGTEAGLTVYNPR